MTDPAGQAEPALLRGCCGAAGVARFQPGESFPTHYHRAVTEIFVCTMGSINIRIADQVHHLSAGQTATAPAGAIHQTANLSDSTAEIFYIKTPPDMDDFVFVSEG
jgi:quercetin dioxygenase-like cupin family protein